MYGYYRKRLGVNHFFVSTQGMCTKMQSIGRGEVGEVPYKRTMGEIIVIFMS